MTKILISSIFILLFTINLYSKTFYVSLQGNNTNIGNKQNPFKSIQFALNKMSAGDKLYIREGEYEESLNIKNFKSKKSKNYLISNYKNEKVLLKGTKKIKSTWSKYKDNIYKSKLDFPITQLFINKKSLSSARWPNGNWDDGSIWNKKTSFAWPENKSILGKYYNKDLKKFDFSLKGALIIVNSGSFKTYESKITKHKIKSDNFTFDKKSVKVHFSYKDKVYKHGFFLEGKLGFLDEKNEWFFDYKKSIAYIYTNDNPNKQDIEGKVKSYSLIISNSSNIHIKGIDFFASTFKVKNSVHITIENSELVYPSYSKRALGKIYSIDATKMIVKNKNTDSYYSLINSKVSYSDGPALELSGRYNKIINNYMHNIDYTCTYKGGFTLNMVKSKNLLFKRNTVHTTGCSELFKAGEKNIIEYNNLYNTGYLQNDGSMIQLSVKAQDGGIVRYNWLHDSLKQALRFDNKNIPNSPYGLNGSAHNNVAWNTQRIFFKGDNHYIYNNVSFNSSKNDLIISSNKKIQGHNTKTITRNNLSNKFSGHRVKITKVPGISDHNYNVLKNNAKVQNLLRDINNRDFRLKKDSFLIDAGITIKEKNQKFLGKSIDIGAYESSSKEYWIPGFKDNVASQSIPKNKTQNAKINTDLIWLKAYKSNSSNLYFADTYKKLITADVYSIYFKGRYKNNIYSPKNLRIGQTYFWRIDSVYKNNIKKGKIWSFRISK